MEQNDLNQTAAMSRLPLVGAWKLVSFESRVDDGALGYPFGPAPQGGLIYTASGRFAVQLLRAGRPRFADQDPTKGSAAEIKASFEGCIAYYGTYQVEAEAGYVVHHVEGSLFPNSEGVGLKRFYQLAGQRLTLTTPPTVWGGASHFVGRLVWERVE